MHLEGTRNPLVAREGMPFLALAGVAFIYSLLSLNVILGVPTAFLCGVLYLLFRDPQRDIPAAPLGVVSPVDGRVIDINPVDKGVLHGEAHRIRIQIDAFGTYTARAPIEGQIMDLRSVAADNVIDYRTNALWIRTDEGDDVVLQFAGYRFGLAPSSFGRFGERVGQGQRCAYLRLTRIAELHLPLASRVLVRPGQIVVAGSDLVAKVPHP